MSIRPLQFVAFFAALFLQAWAAHGESVTATYDRPTDVPVTASNYTATGKTVDFALHFAPATGAELTVVNNTGLEFINGTFTGLAQGQLVSLSFGGRIFQFSANYYGGTGNDLVLVWADNRLFAWGSNFYGELGDGTIRNIRKLPVPTAGFVVGKTVVSMASGGGHTLAVCSDGTLSAWGSNNSGQIALENTSADSLVPFELNTGALAGKTVVSAAAGELFSLALCSDGTVVAWGRNDFGNLGDNSTIERRSPVAVSTSGALSGKSVVSIAAGRMHSVVLCSDGTLAAWGWNDYGQLGDNTTTTRMAPVLVDMTGVLSGKIVIAIAAGNIHSLALCSDGTVVAWGYNGSGQLGDNSTTNRSVPVALYTAGVLAGKSVVSISAGNAHSMASCSDGSVATWGSNVNGTLGDNTTTDRSVPVAVSTAGVLSGKTVVSIAARHSHSLALCSDGTVAAWGSNFSGQLGYDGFTDSSVPVTTVTPSLGTGTRFTRIFSGSAAFNSFASVAAPPVPAIALFNGSSTAPADERRSNVGSFRFANTPTGASSAAQTFTIRNTGTAPLTGLTVTKAAIANPDDFTIANLGATTLAPSAATTFTVSFSPTTSGVRSAVVQIACSELSQPAFSVNVCGSDGSAVAATYTTGSEVPLVINEFSAAGMRVNFALNYAPVTGTELMVVKNTGGSFIEGNFAGLAHGQTVSLSFGGKIYNFVANYYGGTGNDLVLTWASTRLFAWGQNDSGKLGDGTTTSRNLPVPVNNAGVLFGKTVLAVTSGNSHSLALCSDGTLAAWGKNDKGQLGDLTTTQRTVPVAVNVTGVLAGKTVVGIAAGQAHSLAVCSDGTVAAWGDNSKGQLGDNPMLQSNTPIIVNATGAFTERRAVSVAAMRETSMAVCSDGTVVGWGANDGLIGDGTSFQHKTPVAASLTGALFGKSVAAINLGELHTLALCSDATLVAWGNGSRGELGDGLKERRSLPGVVLTTGALSGKTVQAIVCGGGHSLALCTDATLVAWGDNLRGQLGVSVPSESLFPVEVSSGVLEGRTVVSISAGQYHTHALCSDGTLAAWGDNSAGQLGDNSWTIQSLPVAVNTMLLASGERFTGVFSSGEANHCFALVASSPAPEISVFEGTIPSPTNELGNNFRSYRFVNTPLGTSTERTFTITNSGTAPLTDLAVTKGSSGNPDDFSISNLGATTLLPNTSTTFTVTFFPTVAGVRSAAIHIISGDVDENPFVINVHGSDGSPLVASYTTGTETALTINGITATGIAADLRLNFTPVTGVELMVVNNTGAGFIEGTFTGLPHGQMVTLSSGAYSYQFVANYYGGTGNDLVLVPATTRTFAWGRNDRGQLGDNSISNRSQPAAVVSTGVLAGKTVLALTAGESYSMALCSDGTLAAWGDNVYGQLGIGTTAAKLIPTQLNLTGVLAGKSVVSIAAGQYHSLALCSDGTLAGWGANNVGQLGDNSSVQRTSPVGVNLGVLSGKTVTSIAAGRSHSIALCSDGTLAAWGLNSSGQLGDGTTNDQIVAVAVHKPGVLAGKHLISIDAGRDHNIAICSDGTVAAWGDNSKGQLGDNTTTPRLEPIAVTSGALTNKTVIAIAAGESHTLALCSDGTLAAWGDNFYGQLGDNTNAQRNVPVSVTLTGVLAGKTIVSIAAGRAHNLVQCLDGTLVSWGRNFEGELGDRTLTNRKLPVTITALVASQRFTRGFSGCQALHSLGLAVSPPVPEISVFDGSSPAPQNERQNGGGSFRFPQTQTGSSITQSFTIANVGGAPLVGLSLSKTAAGNPQDFTVEGLEATTLNPNGTMTFTVTFSPTIGGLRSAVGQIASNDGDENPFIINLDGFGINQQQSWRQFYFGTVNNTGDAADSATPQHDGITNLMKFATGMDPTKPGFMPGVTTRAGSDLLFTYFRSKAAISDGVTFTIEWRDSLDRGNWSNVGVTEIIIDRGALEEVTAKIPAGSNGSRFLHLRVNAP